MNLLMSQGSTRQQGRAGGGGRTGRLLRASKAGGSQRVKLQKLHFIQMLQLDVSSYCKGKHVMHGYDGNLPEGGMQMYVE